jgi:predicted dehydrogenase
MSIGIGIYGTNGHQIETATIGNGLGRVVAAAGIPEGGSLPEGLRGDEEITRYETLEEMLADSRVEIVSLCSTTRWEQAGHAMQALRAGKHVYAEKPCAMDEASLGEILKTASECGRMFREMAGTAFDQPYLTMRKIIAEGQIGEVVQVICEKSYPYHAGRPQDEDIDGGLIEQCAVHAMRFIEQVAGMKVQSVDAVETTLGNPIPGGGLRMAASLMLRLENGGVASMSANYLNPRGTGVWGDESLKVLGTLGIVESLHGGKDTRLVIGEKDYGPLKIGASLDYFVAYLKTISGEGEMPLTLEEELSPTRWVIRAKHAAVRATKLTV